MNYTTLNISNDTASKTRYRNKNNKSYILRSIEDKKMSPSIQYKHSSDVFSELIDLGVRAKKSSLFLYANMSRVLREAVPTTWYLSP